MRGVYERRNKTLLERFEPKVSVNPITGCHDWIGCKSGGYGQIYGSDGKPVLAHRVAYELFKGAIPDGMHIDHLCRNKLCVNPDHLEPVTVLENTLRGALRIVTKSRAELLTHCKRGHEFTLSNTGTSSKGHRFCRICQSENIRRHQQENHEHRMELQRIRRAAGRS